MVRAIATGNKTVVETKTVTQGGIKTEHPIKGISHKGL